LSALVEFVHFTAPLLGSLAEDFKPFQQLCKDDTCNSETISRCLDKLRVDLLAWESDMASIRESAFGEDPNTRLFCDRLEFSLALRSKLGGHRETARRLEEQFSNLRKALKIQNQTFPEKELFKQLFKFSIDFEKAYKDFKQRDARVTRRRNTDALRIHGQGTVEGNAFKEIRLAEALERQRQCLLPMPEVQNPLPWPVSSTMSQACQAMVEQEHDEVQDACGTVVPPAVTEVMTTPVGQTPETAPAKPQAWWNFFLRK
jgi:hypothetical protein